MKFKSQNNQGQDRWLFSWALEILVLAYWINFNGEKHWQTSSVILRWIDVVDEADIYAITLNMEKSIIGFELGCFVQN